jgi:hypothetical protein
MAACEENLLDIPLRISYPADTDLVMITDNLGNTFITRWSILKPVPHYVILDVAADTPAGTLIDFVAANGIATSRISEITVNGVGSRQIVASAPSGLDIQFMEGTGSPNAQIAISRDLLATEWIKIIYI